MIRDIARVFRNKLNNDFYLPDGLGVITHLAGLTRVKEVSISQGQIRKVPVPVDCDEVEEELCNDCEPIFKLVPDQTKRCIVYFEGTDAKLVQSMPNVSKYSCNLVLICWYNSQGFQPVENLHTRLSSLFINKLKSIQTHSQELSIKEVEVISVNDSNGNIFSKYTYSDFRSAYLGCPFGSFSINFKINFSSNEVQSCFSPIVPVNFDGCC
jgi:hypothetical protein